VRYLLGVQSDNHLGKQQPKTLLSGFCRVYKKGVLVGISMGGDHRP